MDDALSQLMASRKTTPPILNNIPPQPIHNQKCKNNKQQIKDTKYTNTTTSINFYDMDSQIKKIVKINKKIKKNENENENENEKDNETKKRK